MRSEMETRTKNSGLFYCKITHILGIFSYIVYLTLYLKYDII